METVYAIMNRTNEYYCEDEDSSCGWDYDSEISSFTVFFRDIDTAERERSPKDTIVEFEFSQEEIQERDLMVV